MSAPIENNDSDNKMPSESCVVVQGEDVLLELDFKNKELKEDVIQWVRPYRAGWSICTREGILEMTALPGGIWGSFFNDCPAKNFLLYRQSPTDCAEGASSITSVKAHVLEAKVSFLPKNWGEQAGLFWYSNDHNYAKLVVEGMKDGTAALVFAVEIRGEPKVLHKEKLELRGSENELVLRLELSPKLVLSACVVHPQGIYVRRIGSFDLVMYHELQKQQNSRATLTDDDWSSDPSIVATASVGIGCHGGPSKKEPCCQTRAKFSYLRVLSMKRGRIQFDVSAIPPMKKVEGDINTNKQTKTSNKDNTANENIEQIGSWRFAADMSNEQKQRIKALIGLSSSNSQTLINNEEAPAETEQMGSWKISSNMPESSRRRLMQLIKENENNIEEN